MVTVMDLELEGQVAVVTERARYRSRGRCALIAAGAKVVGAARNSSPELDELAVTGQLQVTKIDLSELGGPSRLVEQAGDRVDVGPNNVGSAPGRF